MPEISKEDRTELLEIVKKHAFVVDRMLTVEENALNFAIKIFLFAKTGGLPK